MTNEDITQEDKKLDSFEVDLRAELFSKLASEFDSELGKAENLPDAVKHKLVSLLFVEVVTDQSVFNALCLVDDPEAETGNG